MQEFDPAQSFGPEVAARYDRYLRGDEEDAAIFLAERSKGGSALEFAIGTGRIALELAKRGVEVEGIELSPHMVERLRAKPGGQKLEVVVGDMTTVVTGRQYRIVYLVYNTIFNLLTADDQIRCFENAARHLDDNGVFVVEAALPHSWIAPGEAGYVRAEHVEVGSVRLDVATYDPVTQLLEENHVTLSPEGINLAPIVCRLITPSEMDLMARLAGLRLVERFGDWRGASFGATSTAHVSVYELAQ